MSRSPGAVLGLLAIAIGGVMAYKRYERNQVSPFALWEIRAGMPFDALDDQAQKGEHKRFKCRTIEAGVRLCEIPTDGPIGVMRLAVDSADRAMIVQFRVTDTTLKMIEEARKVAAQWSVVDPHHTSRHADGQEIARWANDDLSWTATIAKGASSSLPSAIELVDERRLERTMTASAPVLLRLAQAGYIDASAVDAALARSPNDVAAAARAMGASGRALASAAAKLPACAFSPGDTIVSGAGINASYDRRQTSILEQAVAQAYPGMRLRLEHNAYLVDVTGAAEEVRIVTDWSDANEVGVALTFPHRVSAVHQRLEMFLGDSTGACRAAADIIVARRDSASGKVVDVQRLELDEEALATQVIGLDFTADENAIPLLVVHYSATYGTQRWIGEVDWNALIVPRSDSLHVARRVPSAVGWKDAAAQEKAGLLVVEKESAAGLHLALMEMAGAMSFTMLILPPGPHGLASGWVLVDLL